jgi:hypothetical protein
LRGCACGRYKANEKDPKKNCTHPACGLIAKHFVERITRNIDNLAEMWALRTMIYAPMIYSLDALKNENTL